MTDSKKTTTPSNEANQGLTKLIADEMTMYVHILGLCVLSSPLMGYTIQSVSDHGIVNLVLKIYRVQ